MQITYRDDDKGIENTVEDALLVPFGILNGEIRQSNGTFWRFKNGDLVDKNATPKS